MRDCHTQVQKQNQHHKHNLFVCALIYSLQSFFFNLNQNSKWERSLVPWSGPTSTIFSIQTEWPLLSDMSTSDTHPSTNQRMSGKHSPPRLWGVRTIQPLFFFLLTQTCVSQQQVWPFPNFSKIINLKFDGWINYENNCTVIQSVILFFSMAFPVCQCTVSLFYMILLQQHISTFSVSGKEREEEPERDKQSEQERGQTSVRGLEKYFSHGGDWILTQQFFSALSLYFLLFHPPLSFTLTATYLRINSPPVIHPSQKYSSAVHRGYKAHFSQASFIKNLSSTNAPCDRLQASRGVGGATWTYMFARLQQIPQTQQTQSRNNK